MRARKRHRYLTLLLVILPGLLWGRTGPVILEVDHLTIVARDGVGALAVRDLASSAHKLWSSQERFELRSLAPVTLILASPSSAPRRSDPSERVIVWSVDTSRQQVIREIAECWMLANADRGNGRPLSAWRADALVVALLIHLNPSVEEKWIHRAGPFPPSGREVVSVSAEGGDPLLAQRWLLREWQLVESARQDDEPDAETRWAAYFLTRQETSSGPFLNMRRSARYLEALGQVNVRRRGVETRLWFHQLPVNERRAWRAHWSQRALYLRASLERVHPVYARSAVALAGALSLGPEEAEFAQAFPKAWAEANTTRLEIEAILKRN